MANEYGNYATLDPLVTSLISNTALSEGNLKVITSGDPGGDWWNHQSTLSIPTNAGKKYVCEMTFVSDNGIGSVNLGVKGIGFEVPSGNGDNVYYNSANGRGVVDDSNSETGATFTTGNVIRMEIDTTGSSVSIEFFKDNASQFTETNTFTDNNIVIIVLGRHFGTIKMNFGATAFAHTPTSGFEGLSTASLPTPAVINYEDEYYIEAGISHTNGSTTAVTLPKTVSGGAMVRIKETDATTDWIMFDTVRGVNKSKDWNQAEAEDTSTFDDQNLTGTTFTMPSDLPSGTYLLECFYVGSYFQIQTVTGNAGARTITWPTEMDSYGFSAFFPRSGASSGIIHHKDIGAQQVLFADGAGAVADRANFSQAPNKTDFRTPASVGPDFNLNTIPYVCYGWANSGPYSFGSYNGNQSTDGAFVNLGGFPQVIVSKPPNTGDSYLAMYHPLLGYNPNGVRQYWEENYANSTSTSDGMLDFVSNGVKFRTAGTGNNSTNSGYGTYLYFAFGIQSLTDGGVNQGRAK